MQIFVLGRDSIVCLLFSQPVENQSREFFRELQDRPTVDFWDCLPYFTEIFTPTPKGCMDLRAYADVVTKFSGIDSFPFSLNYGGSAKKAIASFIHWIENYSVESVIIHPWNNWGLWELRHIWVAFTPLVEILFRKIGNLSLGLSCVQGSILSMHCVPDWCKHARQVQFKDFKGLVLDTSTLSMYPGYH